MELEKKSSTPDLTWLSVSLVFVFILIVLIGSSMTPYPNLSILYYVWIAIVVVSGYGMFTKKHIKINIGILIAFLAVAAIIFFLGRASQGFI